MPRIDAWSAAAREVNPDIIVLCHGGPIATPEDAQTILQWCPQCHGFYGASSMERLPTEVALTQQTKRFVAIRRNGKKALESVASSPEVALRSAPKDVEHRKRKIGAP